LNRYNSTTGKGGLGVEFAGTAVTSSSAFGRVNATTADGISKQLVGLNPDLQWSEGYYRGFFTLTVTPDLLTASFYSMRNVSSPNLDAFVSAVFEVKKGESSS
jgi:alkaline phosphatase D